MNHSTKNNSSPPRRPNPDQTSSPDKTKKSSILNTSSPRIEQTQMVKSNIHDEVKITRQQNKSLQEENTKLIQKIKNMKKHIGSLKDEMTAVKEQNTVLREETTKLLGSNYRGISITKESFYKNMEDCKPKKIHFEDFDKNAQQHVFQQFNRQMAQVHRLYDFKLNQTQFRLDKVTESHKKVCEYLVENKIDQIHFTMKKNNTFNFPKFHQRGQYDTNEYSSREHKTAIKHQGKHKLLMQLQSELLMSKNKNKELMKELKMKDDLIKHQVDKTRGRKHSLQDLRARANSKSSVSDINNTKLSYEQLKKQNQRLVGQLESEKHSKDKSERALQVVQNNFEISQASLELMKKQNENLKHSNGKIVKQLENSRKISQKMSESMVRLDSAQKKKQRLSQFLNNQNNSPSPSKRNKNKDNTYQQQILIFKTKVQRLEYQNQQLHLLRKKYQAENTTLSEQIRGLENAVNQYLYSSTKSYQSQKGLEGSRRKDPEFQMIQRTLQEITGKLRVIQRDIKGETEW